MGRHNALNALAAGLSVRPVAGRLQSRLGAGGAYIIDDAYNANPSFLAVALETLATLPGKKLLVLGDVAGLGDDADTWHSWAGQAACAADVVELFTIGDLAHLATENFGLGAHPLTGDQALVKALLPRLRRGVFVLAKGSRCMAMESFIEKLLHSTR